MPAPIIVPLDGSAFAARALPTAATLARRRGAPLHLLSVHTPLATALVQPTAPAYDPTFDREQRAAVGAAIARLADRLQAELGVPATTQVRTGDPAEAIADEAERLGAPLVVMTTHGRGGFVRAWLGSVADALVRRGGVPVLLVRPEAAGDRDVDEAAEVADFTGVADPAAFDLAGTPRLAHVLVPLDGSRLAEQILEPALALGAPGELRVTLLRVAPAPPSAMPLDETLVTEHERSAMRAGREEAEAYLAGMAERVRAAGYAVEPVVVADHDPARAILREARTRGAELVALSTNARSGLARLRLGSVADKLVRAGSCPTLVLRPRE